MASSKAAKPVVLHQDKREKAMYEDFGDLFAIIKTTEKLERCARTKRCNVGREANEETHPSEGRAGALRC